MRKEYKIVDEAGLHARPASILVQVATKFPNNIMIEYNGTKLTLKSIMAVMSLGVPQNSTIAIEVDGDNAKEVFDALEKILEEHQLV
jgi:phosphocarrier protein